jgi:hypothetical protein
MMIHDHCCCPCTIQQVAVTPSTQPAFDLIVVEQFRMSGRVVVFAAFILIFIVAVCQRQRNIIERNGGIKRPTNTLPKACSNAQRLMVVLHCDDPVVHLHCVRTSVAPARVATVAWPP